MFALPTQYTRILWAVLTVVVVVSILLPNFAGLSAQAEDPAGAPAEVADPNSIASGGQQTDDLSDGLSYNLASIIYRLMTMLGATIMWWGGRMLDLAMAELVIGMGTYMQGGVGFAVDSLWILVRDSFNVLFIFGLIYIGFRVLLFSEDSQAKKTVGWLIIAALMINFSLFITKAIVDFTNATAITIYESTAQTQQTQVLGSDGQYNIYRNTEGRRGIAAPFIDVFNITTFADPDIVASADSGKGGRLAIYGILMGITMILAGFVFAAGAFFMISRFIALIIFMILSPVMFLGMILPLFKNYQRIWWTKFLQSAFVAPAYVFTLYVALFVIQGLGIQGGSFATAFAEPNNSGAFLIFINFAVVAGFLIAAIVVAQGMGTYGARGAMGMLDNSRRFAVNRMHGIRRGVQGGLGRWTVGRPASAVNKALEARGVPSTSIGRRALTSAAGLKFGSSKSRTDQLDRRKKLDATKRAEKHAFTRKKGLNNAIANYTRNNTDAHKIELERQVRGASPAELAKLLSEKKTTPEQYKNVINAMKSGQYDKVLGLKEEDFAQRHKDRLEGARVGAVKNELRELVNANLPDGADQFGAVTEANEAEILARGISQANMSQLSILGANTVAAHADKLKASQIDDVKKDTEKFTPTEKQSILKAHGDKLWNTFNDTPRNVFAGKKDKDIAKYPARILTDRRAVQFLNKNLLAEMKNELGPEERRTIRNNIVGMDRRDLIDWLNNNNRGIEF